MKLFQIGLASALPEDISVALELQKHHEIAYWVRLEDAVPLDESAFPKTIFHNYRDALKNIPPKAVEVSAFEPWSRDAIVGFSTWEAEIMSMMDKWYPDWPVNKRKDFYYDLLRYWGGILERYKPDAIVFIAPPHQMFDFVLYAIAKHHNVTTIMFDIILQHDSLIIYKDYKFGNEILASESKRGFENDIVALEDLSSHVRDYYLEVSGDQNPAPKYVEGWKKEHSGWNKFRRHGKSLIPFFKDGSIIERAVLRIFKVFKRNARDEYRKYERAADFSKPYVYVPLHYQPECTTSPQGGIFVDQLLMVKILSAALPAGWELYVKEHHGQWLAHAGEYTSYRWHGFFEDMATLPNVRLVPSSTNTFTLTEHAQTVATITGTAGLEAVFRGKNALVFGYPWFMHCPGVFRVTGVSECREAFKKIIDGFVPRKSDILSYLAAVDKVSCRGYLNIYGKQIAKYSGEDSWRHIHHAIEEALTS